MLVFISDYPNKINIRDGMMQRVAAIDSLVQNKKRTYLSISFRKNTKRRTLVIGNCTVEYVNLFLHLQFIKKVINSSKLVYVHSIYNFSKILFLVQKNKTVLDIHGIVPEEMTMMGYRFLSYVFNKVEKHAIWNSRLIIHVTDTMLDHYESKYINNINAESLVFPIFEPKSIQIDQSKWCVEKLKIVYAGGVQVWQNIELMVDVIKSFENYPALMATVEFYIFLPENQVKSFSERYSDLNTMGNVIISSLPKEELISFLSGCHIGFVLRDATEVNNVACPTKLVEYLECGVVPIVKDIDIGDFYKNGYKSINCNAIVDSLDLKVLEKMATHNLNIINEMKKQSAISKGKLEEILNNGFCEVL